MDLKRCSKCNAEKSVMEFALRSDRPGRRYARCHSCRRTASAAVSRRLYHERRDTEEGKWRRIQMRVACASQSAREWEVENTLTVDEWLGILERFSYQCAYCERSWESIDHVIPFSKGGPNTETNVVPACKNCNSSKFVSTTWTPRPVNERTN